jgi:hypothetical protein
LINSAISDGGHEMKSQQRKVWQVAGVAVAIISLSSCSNINQSAKPARELVSCPPGQYLVCETQQPLSKGGAEEEIPEYEYCRCH